MTILWVRELLRRIAFCFNGSSLIAILPRRQFHVDRLAESRTRGAAVRKFGNQTQLKERSRDAWRWAPWSSFFRISAMPFAG